MKLQVRRGENLIFLDKPAGLPTHASDVGKQGLVEFTERELGQKLWVVHRLDKTTSGALAFATSAARAEELRRLFESHEVKKTYWFLTDRPSSDMSFAVSSRVEKRGSSFVSLTTQEPNSTTRFQRIKRSPFFELWEAKPLTGKPHQIRLHAAQAGLPILGDELYGGTPFPHLCLHAQSLQIPGEDAWTCAAPRFFERLGVLKDPELVQILSSIDRRQRLYSFLADPEMSVRLIHTEHPHFRLDKFGKVLWLNWYKDQAPTERDLERWDFVRNLLSCSLVIQKRQDRGVDPNSQTLWTLQDPPTEWTATENGASFQFRREQGLSAGLFLDQRKNRMRVRELSSGKKVLNLFAYTGGFSVMAALGGAEKVTTVDLSKNFLRWGQSNFQLNGLDPEKHEWSAADSFFYLEGALKRERRWDLIICDPPSFSRAGKKVFKLKEDLENLVELCLKALAPTGTLLFSCNIESLTAEEIQARLLRLNKKLEITPAEQDLDFELLDENRSLKAFWIR